MRFKLLILPHRSTLFQVIRFLHDVSVEIVCGLDQVKLDCVLLCVQILNLIVDKGVPWIFVPSVEQRLSRLFVNLGLKYLQ
ncbi:MAG: hypothetical protein ACI9HY_003203 [Planctomycetaceae bacterium]|jgi:hypothetical protein